MFDEVARALTENGYSVHCFATGAEAAAWLKGEIRDTTVGFGGSVTLDQLGLYELLGAQNTVVWHWRVPEGSTANDMRRSARQTAVYLSSANGLSEDGAIVNIDGSGNRIAETLYGHERVIFVIGHNKLAPDVESAIHRARNIAAPRNAQRLQTRTPCAVKGDRCYDCKSPARICRALSVLWRASGGSRYDVVLVDEELGY